MPFSHPQASFPWSSICSLKGIFISPKKAVYWHFGTKRTKRCKMQHIEAIDPNCQTSSYLSNLQGGWLLLLAKPEYLGSFQMGPFMCFPMNLWVRFLKSIRKFTLFCIDAPWRFYLAINCHLPQSWQNTGCDYTYYTRNYYILEPLPAISYLYLEKTALKKINLRLGLQDIVSYSYPHLNTLDMLPVSSCPV